MTKDYFKRVVATDIITKAIKKILDYIFVAASIYFIICVICAG